MLLLLKETTKLTVPTIWPCWNGEEISSDLFSISHSKVWHIFNKWSKKIEFFLAFRGWWLIVLQLDSSYEKRLFFKNFEFSNIWPKSQERILKFLSKLLSIEFLVLYILITLFSKIWSTSTNIFEKYRFL